MIILPSKVLITNFNYKNTLAAVRALGENGLSVVTSGPDPKRRAASFSKYCDGWRVYSRPGVDMGSFISDIKKILQENSYDLILPIGVDTTIPISYHKKELSALTEVPVADYEILERAHDKHKTIEAARNVDVPVPDTYLLRDGDLKFPKRYPVVVKARKGASGSGTRYASSREELDKVLLEFENRKSNDIFDYREPMIQEYIPGEIRDVCVLFNHGDPKAAVVQRRVITYPPSGGVGIVNETIEEPYLVELTFRLLKEINWHGVAQVEYKYDGEGAPRLMEVNPKFWGTLELSIAAGVNFPFMLYKITMDGDVEPCFAYKRNIQMWWWSAHYPQIILAFLKNRNRVVSALTDSNKKIVDLSLRDMKPHLIQFFQGITRLVNFKSMLTHPLSR